MNCNLEDILYSSGLTAQGCWDQLDDYDRAAIIQAIYHTIYRCVEIFTDYEKTKSDHNLEFTAYLKSKFDL